MKEINQNDCFNTMLIKECSKCHEIKPYSQFSERKDLKSTIPHTRSICKKCRAIVFAIKTYRFKLKVVTNIYQGKFNGKCSKCQIDIKRLPVLEFHHLDPKSKTISWKDVSKKNWKETIEILEKEKVDLLCRNCHTKEGSKVFNKYHKIILKNNLFDFPSLLIEKMVINYVLENQKEYNKKVKFLVLEWIKKRKIIEDLYGGKCVGCNQINIHNNLPSLEFHHPNDLNLEKKLRWKNIRNYNLETIIKQLIKEECLCLCSNCHKLIHSHQFVNNLKQIFNSEMAREIKKKIEKIKFNIKNFKVDKSKNIVSSNKIFGYGENWKKFLLYIYVLSVDMNDRLVEKKQLKSFIGITERNINKNLRNLKEINLIEVHKIENTTSIKLTPKAYEELKKILLNLKKYKNIQNNIPYNNLDKEIRDLIRFSKKLQDLS